MSKDKDKQSQFRGQKYLVMGFLSFFCLCILAQVKPTAVRRTAKTPAAAAQRPIRKLPAATATALKTKSAGPQTGKTIPPQKGKSAAAKKGKKGSMKKNGRPLSLAERNRGKGLTRIDLIHADVAREDNFLNPDVEVLVGNVKLLHGHMYMFCDSALIMKKTNSVQAYNHVKMKQGDTLFIYGDYLNYDGISQIARLRGKVKMVNRKTTLLTDSLNYDRVYNLAYYFEGGTVMDADNVLTSDWGEYSPATKIALFDHEVKLVNPRFVLSSDTLRYNTRTKIATILGPSTIVSNKNVIHSNKGDYNTVRDDGWLFDRSVLTSGTKKLVGDSVFYDRKKGYGRAFHNVIMKDTLNKCILKGDYCYYNEKNGSAFATKKALGIDYSQKDSMFIHADTLYMRTFNQKTDSMYRVMRAYHKVRMFRNDVQGVCDSLVYITRDSCLTMYKDPIIWNDKQQLLGEVIHAYFNDSTITWAHIVNQALTVERMDSLHYNQVTGKEIKAYFKDKELSKVDVISNVDLVYYPLDKDSTMLGMNTSETSLLNLYMKQKKMDKMVMSPKSNGIFYPLSQAPVEKMKLPNFAWFDYIRPKDKNDLFDWRGKQKDQILKATKDDRPEMKNRSLRDLIK